jgi:hypothetical protein
MMKALELFGKEVLPRMKEQTALNEILPPRDIGTGEGPRHYALSQREGLYP